MTRFFGPVADVVRQGEAAARAAAARGRQVCGWLGQGVPVHLIEAAGLHPIELSAGDVRETPLADEYMEDLFDLIVRGVFERLLRGDYAYLSAIVLPRAGDSVHRMYYYLCELRRMGVASLPEPLLSDGLQAPGAPAADYTADRMRELAAKLAAIKWGKPTADTAGLAAERADLLATFAARRAAGTMAVSGAVALGVYAAARVLPHEVFAAGLRDALHGAPAEPMSGDTHGAVRVVIAGSPHDDAGLHGVIEAAGAVVAGDYHAAGELGVGEWTPRGFADASAEIVAFAKAVRADALVFSFYGVEEALTWDYPAQVAALEAAGVATARLGEQVRPYAAEAAVAPVAELVARVRGRRA